MEEIAVRELKSCLSAYLSRATAGERFIVTSHGRPVAALSGIVPPPAGLPDVPGVHWVQRTRKLPRLNSLPVIEKPLADLVVAERDHAVLR